MIRIFYGDAIEKELSRIKKTSLETNRKVEKIVKDIVDDVFKNGDKALFKYSKKFDGVAIDSKSIRVGKDEIKKAYEEVGKDFIKALRVSIANVTSYHEKQKVDQWFETGFEDIVLGQRALPIEKVGIYVPGGACSYPSSVVMSVVPAKIAGVKRIVIVTPPMRGKKKINPYTLVAANELNVEEIYKIGGAQAIAALAYGTESIPKVDKIVGPGNIFVTIAKRFVFGDVGIDKLAGPSDVLIVADESAPEEFIASDLLAQAEHDPNSRAILITTSKNLAEKVLDKIKIQISNLSRRKIVEDALNKNSGIFVVEGMWRAIEIVNDIAPEHLELLVSSPQTILEDIKNAGAVFLGPYSPVSVGDYIAGPNHVLPTHGTARFSSPLSVYDFIKTQSVIGYTKPALKEVYRYIKILAEMEGLDAHSKSVEVRLKESR